MKDITVGQYYSGNSVLHRSDARLKLYFMLVFTVLCLICSDIPALLLCILTVFIAIACSKVPLHILWKRTRTVFLLIFILSVFTLFTTEGNALGKLGILVVTEEGLCRAGFLLTKLYLIALAAALTACTTTPTDILDGLTEGFHIKNDFAMSLVLALSFLPILSDEMNRIRIAQAARGADVREGSIWIRMKHTISIMIPLFRAAIDRSEKMADAMDVRCYDSEAERSRLEPLKYSTIDWIGFCYMIILTVGFVFLNFFFSTR